MLYQSSIIFRLPEKRFNVYEKSHKKYDLSQKNMNFVHSTEAQLSVIIFNKNK